jgi:hypothetical protein
MKIYKTNLEFISAPKFNNSLIIFTYPPEAARLKAIKTKQIYMP